MITLEQIENLSKKNKINTTVVAREYLQLKFLQNFYQLAGTENVFFKGGTAIHFLMDGFRFSEDLDFTSETGEKKLNVLVVKAIENMQKSVLGLNFKEKGGLGKNYLITLEKGLLDFEVFVRLEFSFREKVLQKKKEIIKTDFPVIFTSFVYFLGGEEILAEKFRALFTRSKGRDLFDIWFLLKKGYVIKENFVEKKMKYYSGIKFSWEKAIKKVKKYGFKKFKNDLQPFLTVDKRAKIDELFEIVKKEISNKLLSYCK